MPEENLMEQKKPEVIVDDSLNKILRQVLRKLIMHRSEAEIEFFEKDLTQQSNEKAENVL